MSLEVHLRRNLARYKREGNVAKARRMEERLAELTQPADVDEFHIGGGWYEIDGEKYHGKQAAQEALDGS